MNSGQLLMTVGALILLGTTILTVNKNNLNQGAILRQTEIGMYAVGLATSYFEKASNLSFDEFTAQGNLALATTDLSATLGIDNNGREVAKKDTSFNDFDDYNGFDTTVSASQVDDFHVIISISYITNASPYSTKTATPSWLKQMDVAIIPTVGRQAIMGGNTKAGTDTIKMSYIYSLYQ